MIAGVIAEENGAPREPRFFVRAGWLAALPLAWAFSLAVVLAFQGFSGPVHEARGPAHFHAHGDEGHAHAHVERHHHAPGTAAVVVDDAAQGAPDEARTVRGGFDLVPSPLRLFSPAPIRNRPASAPLAGLADKTTFLPDRPPPLALA